MNISKKTNVFLPALAGIKKNNKASAAAKYSALCQNGKNQDYAEVLNSIKAIATIFVVYIHFNVFTDTGRHFFNEIFIAFRHTAAVLGVPSFFFVSGFLFFVSIKKGEFLPSFKIKIKKRLKSLLIPYLFWNLFGICLGIFYAKAGFATENSYYHGFKFCDILNFPALIWKTSGDIPLWYIKYLFIINLFSPLIYAAFSERVNFYAKRILILAISVLFLIFHHVNYAETLVLFWVIGAFCAVEKIDFIAIASKYFYAFFLMYAVSSAVYLYLHFSCDVTLKRYPFAIFFGVPMFFGLIARFRIKVADIFSRNSFFIYCSHFFISTLYERKISLFYNLNTAYFTCLLVFLFALQIAVCIFAAELLRKACPRFFRFINGGR